MLFVCQYLPLHNLKEKGFALGDKTPPPPPQEVPWHLDRGLKIFIAYDAAQLVWLHWWERKLSCLWTCCQPPKTPKMPSVVLSHWLGLNYTGLGYSYVSEPRDNSRNARCSSLQHPECVSEVHVIYVPDVFLHIWKLMLLCLHH